MAKKVNPNTLLILGGILLVGFFLLSGDGGIGGIGGGASKKKVTCDVSVRNPLIGDNFDITSTQCTTSTSGCGFFSVSTLDILGIFPDEVGVRLIAGGNSNSKVIRVGDFLGGNADTSISVCTGIDVSSGLIELENSDGVITDSQNINF